MCRVQQKHVDEVLEASSRFSKDTEEKILQKMSASLRQREQQFDRLMERLQKHVGNLQLNRFQQIYNGFI